MSQQTFTFLIYQNTASTPYFALDMLENEEAARIRALNLLDESKSFVAVEVSSDHGVAFTIERAPTPSTLRPLPRRADRKRFGPARRRSFLARP